jgi:hypothetical protein
MGATTELTGNGPLPIEQLAVDRESVFTLPDITENRLLMVDLEGTHWFTDKIQLSANVFLRDNDTDSFNGDATPFVGCADDPVTPEDESQLLCEEDQLDDPLVDQRGNFLAEDDFNGKRRICNLTLRIREEFFPKSRALLLGSVRGCRFNINDHPGLHKLVYGHACSKVERA